MMCDAASIRMRINHLLSSERSFSIVELMAMVIRTVCSNHTIARNAHSSHVVDRLGGQYTWIAVVQSGFYLLELRFSDMTMRSACVVITDAASAKSHKACMRSSELSALLPYKRLHSRPRTHLAAAS
eukprot:2747850-Pleurochrysis_carterae.AAC.4